MKIKILRYSTSPESTLGLLFIDDKFFCYTLEDTFHEEKIHGVTRIPEGNYCLDIRKVLSPLTINYRKKYPWFKYHLEIQGIPDFENVYIHIGNKSEDTDGCILVGNTTNNNENTKGFIGNSTATFQKLYNMLYAEIENCGAVELEIINVDKILNNGNERSNDDDRSIRSEV